MYFFIQKMLAAIILPLPISLILLLIGLIFLIAHFRKVAITLILLGLICLFVFSLPFIPEYLLSQLESQYQPLIIAPGDVHRIVVLGGGVRAHNHYPPNTQLNSASLSRLIEGIRLYRQLQTQKNETELILSGGRVFNAPSEAGRMQNVAVMLGVLKQDVHIEEGSKNTYQEAIYLQPKLKKEPFILVTSAVHMPRAMQIFTQLGMHPIPAPTQYISKNYHPIFRYFIPKALNLAYADIAIHEYLGMFYNQLKNP